jgi:hypothetical protein
LDNYQPTYHYVSIEKLSMKFVSHFARYYTVPFFENMMCGIIAIVKGVVA